MAIDDDHALLYVADFYNNRIQILDEKTGDVRGIFGAQAKPAGGLNHPTEVALGLDSSVYVVDWGNHRVLKFRVKVE